MSRTQQFSLLVCLFVFSCGDEPVEPNNATVEPDMGAVRDMSSADTAVSQDVNGGGDVATDTAVSPPDAGDAGADVAFDDMCLSESTAVFCANQAAECGSVSSRDACGRSRTETCGTCPAGESCFANMCNCVPDVDALLCQRAGAECGQVSQTDNCGAARTPNCGTCVDPETCGGGGTESICGCTPQSDAEFCAAMGRDCETVTGNDNCGQPRTADCGSCTAPQTCGGAGQTGVCGCTPSSDAALCAAAGAMCGALMTVDDCGQQRTIDCGGCRAPDTCGGGGAANQCGCSPETDAELCMGVGANCGQLDTTDRCGQPRTVQCGACRVGETCGGSGTANQCGCAPDSDTALCTAAGATCDSITVTDNCGAQRTADCGVCTDPDTCGGGGTANVCGCTTPSDAQLCQDRQASCGNIGVLTCGTGIVVDCGTCSVGTCDANRNQCMVSFTSSPGLAISESIGLVTDTLVATNCTQLSQVTVGVDITHSYRGDVHIALRSPANTVVQLKASSNDSSDDIIGIYPDTLTPAQSLSALAGEAGDGTWTLEVDDTFAQDDGTLNSWTLNLFCQ